MSAAPRKRRTLPAGASEAEQAVFSTWREVDLLNYVLRTARLLGYRSYHTAYSIKSTAGFPDVALVSGRRRRTVYAELKKEGLWPTVGRVRPQTGRWIEGQTDWLRDLQDAGNEVYLWWPSDAQDIARILDDRGPRTLSTGGVRCVERLDQWLEANPPADR
jgi:hypothetical protein